MSDECKPIDVEAIRRDVRELLDAKAALTHERSLTARLRGALEAIAEYDTDFAVGPADNVARLQTIAERALSTPPAAAPVTCEAPACAAWCGTREGSHEEQFGDPAHLGAGTGFCYCTRYCLAAGKPLHRRP